MKYLTDEAARLSVTIETAALPGNEIGRYIHQDKRILIREDLTFMQGLVALSIALGHAFYGDETDTPATATRAEEHAAGLMLARERCLVSDDMALAALSEEMSEARR